MLCNSKGQTWCPFGSEFFGSRKKTGSGDVALPGFLEGAVLWQIQKVEAGVCHRKKVRILPQRYIIKYRISPQEQAKI